ncbi:MAG: hypothetical protein EBS53_17555, partial [Bacteroidetes bacterium]|nr:hypothetical protein [Bacteroidota bacterium]
GGPGELGFRLGAIPIRIQPLFWLTTFVLAGPYFNLDPRPWPVVLFVMACLISIVWHELGHAWAMKLFGARYVEIVLTGFGGYASTQARASRSWQRILIALAGPGNQLVAWGLLLTTINIDALNSALESSGLANLFVSQLLMINLVWPLLNLMPIFPLDGGRVAREGTQNQSLSFHNHMFDNDYLDLLGGRKHVQRLVIWNVVSPKHSGVTSVE